MFLVTWETFWASLSLKALFPVLRKGTGGIARLVVRVVFTENVLTCKGTVVVVVSGESPSSSFFLALSSCALEFSESDNPIAVIEVEDAIGDSVFRSTDKIFELKLDDATVELSCMPIALFTLVVF